jgi:hypothetical protein
MNMNNFFNEADIAAAKRDAQEQELLVRRERAAVVVIDMGSLVDDLIRFMPTMEEARRDGYIEAVRDMLMMTPALALEHAGEDRALRPATVAPIPLERVDQALTKFGK